MCRLGVCGHRFFPVLVEADLFEMNGLDRRQEKSRTDSAGPPTRHPSTTEEMEVEGASASAGPGQHISTATAAGEGSEGKDGGGKDSTKDPQPPQKRYRLTEQMKNIVWQLVLLSNECC